MGGNPILHRIGFDNLKGEQKNEQWKLLSFSWIIKWAVTHVLAPWLLGRVRALSDRSKPAQPPVLPFTVLVASWRQAQNGRHPAV